MKATASTVFALFLLLACTRGDDVVHVAPPTGETEIDRAAILVALEQVQPGGTIQFAPGTYLVGELIRVSIPRVTLQGHAEGTTLRGCDAADFPDVREVAPQDAAVPCNGFELAAGYQTVRGLTFENAWHGLRVGASRQRLRASAGDTLPLDSAAAKTGGHLIEGNTFRNSPNGLRVIGQWLDPTVIRRNRFVNTFHAVVINGRTAHLLDNEIVVPEPEHTNEGGHPSFAIAIFCAPAPSLPSCDGNVIAGNRVEGHPDGIRINALPGASARNNVIRDNTIIVRRVGFPRAWPAIVVRSDSDSTIVGIPLTLSGMVDVHIRALGFPDDGAVATIQNNVIEGNRIVGAEGIGIQLNRASSNRIVNNTITGIASRAPFPGNTLGDDPEVWREANGSAIWISPGSLANEIIGNTFENVTSYAIVIEGTGNIVELRGARDNVRDTRNANRVSRRDPR